MVIGYNPSHSNINSEVNAPFKILSLMLRYLENELSPKKAKLPKNRGKESNEEEKSGSLMSAGYKMKRDVVGEGERLDTIDQNDGDDDDYNPPADLDFGDEQEDEVDSDDGKSKRAQERIEVDLGEINDDDEDDNG